MTDEFEWDTILISTTDKQSLSMEYTMQLTESNAVFNYQERVARAAQAFMTLKDEYLERFGTTFRDAIASDWQVDPLDLDEKVWELNNKK